MKKLIPAVVFIAVIAAVIGGFVMMQGKSVKSPLPVNKTADNDINNPTAALNSPLPSATVTTNQKNKPANFISIPLNISVPVNGASFSNPTLTVKGKTIAKAEVIVNETDTAADTSGNFTADITLDEGDNIISITAIDAEGNSTEKELTVSYNPL